MSYAFVTPVGGTSSEVLEGSFAEASIPKSREARQNVVDRTLVSI
ncbi:hypothetical protein Pedsa_3332 [Pseudopedobacter saltans DSM 12145]|uniref:Uncharacterized protein n=1 Tax=Pseudopedobacter saltans (strain ATCC 51119 / DSM 12145 / JCM 21818 / CCUG 39354 / LMG 10337 / NBRC 100064 / NCIMB 13643) TaxID=762903 RepID=F0SCM3_PSESL|nr:hypothetical protein Pedsa_3332 [Pseudopedobacter saltans DSM 12145]